MVNNRQKHGQQSSNNIVNNQQKTWSNIINNIINKSSHPNPIDMDPCLKGFFGFLLFLTGSSIRVRVSSKSPPSASRKFANPPCLLVVASVLNYRTEARLRRAITCIVESSRE
jgi:hypothetical protein